MRKLIPKIMTLAGGSVGKLVGRRILEFRKLGRQPSSEIFKELCFCLLTANFSAERGIMIQQKIGEGFLTLSQKRLASNLRRMGYRYPNARAKYIAEARKHESSICNYVRNVRGSTPHINDCGAREWLVENVKGLGYKEASHFLRNIGYQDLAIIDFHIIDLLERHGLLARPKTLTKAKYFEIESILSTIAKKTNLTLAELDLYLWYMETGKILK